MQNENLVKRLLFKLTKKISQKYDFTVVVDLKLIHINCSYIYRHRLLYNRSNS